MNFSTTFMQSASVTYIKSLTEMSLLVVLVQLTAPTCLAMSPTEGHHMFFSVTRLFSLASLPQSYVWSLLAMPLFSVSFLECQPQTRTSCQVSYVFLSQQHIVPQAAHLGA